MIGNYFGGGKKEKKENGQQSNSIKSRSEKAYIFMTLFVSSIAE